MLPEYRKELTRRLPDELAFPYFRGREAAWILHQRLSGPTRIAALRAGPLAPLLDRPGVAEVVARCGDGRLTADRLLPLADPLLTFEPGTRLVVDGAAETAFEQFCAADVHHYMVSFAQWGAGLPGSFWRCEQVSRWGENLVLQVNLPQKYADSFLRVFGKDAREALEFDCHPVRGDHAMTMSWARLDCDPGSDEVLIEEIQTDWLRTLRRHRRWLALGWRRKERSKVFRAIDLALSCFGPNWAEATLLAAIVFARTRLGARHIWLHQPHTGKKLKNITFGRLPPRSIYTDLPRRFCFRPTDRAPEILYRARPQAVHRIRRSGKAVFWHLDLDAPATAAREKAA